jgi:putative ABC transport system permease protein
MTLLPYHVRLAAKSIRRAPVVSFVMFAALALADGLWSVAVGQYVRFQAWEINLAPTLHQVEILRPQSPASVFERGAGSNTYLATPAIMSRTQLSYPEARALEQSQAPARQSSGIRAEVLVRGPSGSAVPRIARFTNETFFSMFQRPFSEGAGFSAADEAAGARVVVLGRATGRLLFPRGGALGQTVWIEGRTYRVVGVLAEYQPLNAPWQLLITGGLEDALFLPARDLERLRVYPDQPFLHAPVPPGREVLLASDALMVTSWVDLPTPARVAAYRSDLDRIVGPGQWVLRSLDEWRREFAMPQAQIAFFSLLGVVVLIGGASNLSRWLLAVGLVRADELGIYRALGAPRASIFVRTFAEGMMLGVPAALLAPVVAMPLVYLFNQTVRVVDMPLEVGPLSIALSIGAPLLMSALGSLYPAWRLARTRPTLQFTGGKA